MESPHRQPCHHFPPVPETGAVSFEPLTPHNAAQLYLLLEGDESPFTDERFKSYNSVMEYAADIERWGAFSPKHGGNDWFFKEGGAYVGILHLYDLSLENWNENDQRCWIGFATTPARRRSGFTSEVLSHFIAYIWQYYPRMQYIHAMTLPGNKAAQALLRKTGFALDPRERVSKAHVFYELTRA